MLRELRSDSIGAESKGGEDELAQAAEKPKRGKPRSRPGEKEDLLQAYRTMLTIRRFEERAGQLYGMGLIGGFCHLYIGQEAVVVGMQMAISEGDQVITSYRDHGHMIATGMDPRGVMAELTGRSTGYSRGKGGSMHMFSKKRNFFGGHGIVGSQVSLGTGLAFSNWYRGNDRVSITYFGEGASSQGQVFESFNLAALMKLPVVYVIENNKYGMGTSVERASASKDLSQNGAPWGIPGAHVDGMDVLAVKEAGEMAVAHCRAGKGPYLLEMKTYRYRGHSMSDPARYRSREEVQAMRTQHDCIESVGHRLEQLGADPAELKEIDDDVKKTIKEAADFAQSSPEPDPAELYTDVLVEG
jgi:pyruvate dehydrogenase E1 component alpha subunit